ncbi:MAG: NADH-quinone oxidoreductase subunit NuoF [Planctomycetota bacterium]
MRILVCMTGCRAAGAAEVHRSLVEEVQKAGLTDEVAVVATGCHGLCARAPVVRIEPQGIAYFGVRAKHAERIVRETAVEGKVAEALCYRGDDKKALPKIEDIPFFAHQRKIVLADCGLIDPRRIEEAIARGTYGAFAKALGEKDPEKVIATVTESGLRGRGGAGFATGKKWSFCRGAAGDEKYVVCNADEGDPGAFMDRAVLEGDPHRVIEGMLIAAYAIGARRGIIYVRAEYPIAVEHSFLAIEQAREAGLLGERILGSDFSFEIEVKQGAGAFVCGEETALLASIEGKRGMPRVRPPFPAQSGLWGKPTNINNVETLANLPEILRKGAAWYRAIGTAGSSGTKIFALAGKVRNTGLVEVPMGITLRELVFEVGGGVPKGRTFKAAQTGGPSGGCLPSELLDLPLDYDSLQKAGAIMGSGGLIVMDDENNMVDIARYFLQFVQNESCGKCVPCRVGTKRMLEILDRIASGQGREEDLDLLAELGEGIKKTSLCGLGQTGPNPVLSTLRYFRHEYLSLIQGHGDRKEEAG